MDQDKFSKTTEDLIKVLQTWSEVDETEKEAMKGTLESKNEERLFDYKHQYYTKYLKWYIEQGISVYDNAMA